MKIFYKISKFLQNYCKIHFFLVFIKVKHQNFFDCFQIHKKTNHLIKYRLSNHTKVLDLELHYSYCIYRKPKNNLKIVIQTAESFMGAWGQNQDKAGVQQINTQIIKAQVVCASGVIIFFKMGFCAKKI